jgi:hypothetical protein
MLLLFIRQFWKIIFHKLCILLAGFRINKILHSTSYQIPYKRLLLHDLSKFSRSEFWPYAEHFLGEKKHEEEFHRAWLHHVHHNDHHWEHFIENYPSVSKILANNPQLNNLTIYEMPDEAILEMIADNLAASRSYEGYWPDRKKKDGWPWMTKSYQKYRLHPISKIKFTAFLCALGYERFLPQEFDWTIIENATISKQEKIKLLQLQKLAKLNN